MINLLFLTWALLFPAPGLTWHTDFDTALREAQASHKMILVTFTGSDWCSHCMRMEKTILQKPCFTDYAVKNLVLLNADFPRKKKNKLSDEQVKKNEKLSAKYNPSGALPVTLLLDENGKVLHKWEGSPKEGCDGFVTTIKSHAH
jgi:thioredoxin-related protein